MNSNDAFLMLAVLVVVILSLPSAGALSIISPAQGDVIASRAVIVEYTTLSTSCTAELNGAPVALAGCSNFTIAVADGENNLSIDDGFERKRVTFYYSLGNMSVAMGPLAGLSRAPAGLTIRGRSGFLVPYVTLHTGAVQERTMDIRGRPGRHQVSIEPVGSRIKRVLLYDVSVSSGLDLGLEQIPPSVMPTSDPALDAFAIDPTRIDFTNGTITKTAVGNRVWKCVAWDFDAQVCNDDWVLAQLITPGQDYELAFDAIDPAYVETFDDSVANDISITALDNTTLVIAFIDGGTNHASFEIWDTNGILLVNETDIDTTGDAESRISIDAINSTHFVVGVLDGPLDDANFYIYDRTGSQTTGLTQVDANTGINDDLSLCQLGDRFAYTWTDGNDGDANYEIWDNTGVRLVNELAVDTTITPGAIGQNLAACSPLNATHWGYAFFDDADNDASLAILTAVGTVAVAAVDLDIDVGETGQVTTAGLRGNRVAVAFYDSTDDDITITIRALNGGAMSTILGNADIDVNAGTNSRVSAAEVESNGASNFVVAWQDTSDTTIKAAVYDNTGGQVTAPFTVTTTPSTTALLLDVTGRNSVIGTGLCNSTFAIAYTNASGTAVFETYYLNGTIWDGVCVRDTTSPHITLIHPPADTTNTTNNTIDFLFNITDANDMLNCTLLIDDVPTADIAFPATDTTLNFTLVIENGFYNWSVLCYDLQSNMNTSETRNLTIDVPVVFSGADIRLAALDNSTVIVAFIDSSANDASYEIWDTRGIRIVSTVDVDDTVNANSRIAVSIINSTQFVIGVMDGPEADADFYIYDWDGTQSNQVLGQTQVDPTTGTNTDLAICQVRDRFTYSWADSGDGDANYEIWDNTGVQFVNELAVDTAIAPGTVSQNLIACGMLNNTYWGYAFYDDADNDISLSLLDLDGSIIVSSVDLDIDVGETGQVAAAGMRGDRIAVSYYDSIDQDITMTIRSANGAAMSTIFANADIDTAAGAASRLAMAEIEHSGASDFVVAWQDTSDTTIKAAVYDNTGGQVTAPFTVTATPSTSSLLLDVVGFNSNLGLGLCNGTFGIAYTNDSGNSLFETFYLNGTRWSGQCGFPPNVTRVRTESSIVLNAGTTKTVECNLTVVDLDGVTNLVSANATIYHETSSPFADDDPYHHLTNSSCAISGSSGNEQNYTCRFSLPYYAQNGTWYCEGNVRDVYRHTGTNLSGFIVDPLYAINVTDVLMDFGVVPLGNISSNITQNFTNFGNQHINISVYGYGMVPGDNNSFNCNGRNISVGLLKFAPNVTATYDQKVNLSSTVQKNLGLVLPARNDTSFLYNTSYWQVMIPQASDTPFLWGQCNGTIIFQAELS